MQDLRPLIGNVVIQRLPVFSSVGNYKGRITSAQSSAIEPLVHPFLRRNVPEHQAEPKLMLRVGLQP